MYIYIYIYMCIYVYTMDVIIFKYANMLTKDMIESG